MHAIFRSLWALGLPFLLLGTVSAPRPAASQSLVGTWVLISETVERGGQTVEPFGPNPLGTMMLDAEKHFMLMIARPGLPKMAANRRDGGTADENREVLAGSLAFFGTYAVAESDKLLTVHVEASTFPNWIGTDQKRYFALAGDEMTWTNRSPAVSGESAKLVWRRQKQAGPTHRVGLANGASRAQCVAVKSRPPRIFHGIYWSDFSPIS